jgi:hypothetical protein
VEGQVGGDLLGPEDTGVFLFVHQLDPPYPHVVVIEVEFLGIVHRVPDFHPLPDIGGRDLVYGPFEADGGIIVDDPFMADEEDFIQFGLGEPADLYS